MRVLLDHDRATLLCGDSSRVGDILAPRSVDSLVCDPPAGIGFMGKAWDAARGGRAKWVDWLTGVLAPSYAALKPGAHGLVWSLPRTQHWTMLALEDLGFEIRDVVSHVFGSGFPKSRNVSIDIDGKLGAERAVIGTLQHRGGAQHKDMSRGGNVGDNMANGDGWTGEVLGGPVTDEARRWHGWGTALKPAYEPWILVRKPLDGTVADNVLRWGCGALAIDVCRIGTDDVLSIGAGALGYGGADSSNPGAQVAGGRWPANLVLSHDEDCMMVGVEDERVIQCGAEGKALGEMTVKVARYDCVAWCPCAMMDAQPGVPKGGASRYFYCAKPAKRECELGLDHLPIRTGGEATGREDGSDGLKSPRAGAGRGGGRRNVHPTKKSVALMRYLTKMVTPAGGVVLDPFAGSGTTGVAALSDGFRFLGVEQGGDPGATEDDKRFEYLPILVGRVRHSLGLAAEQPEVTFANAR